MLSVILALPVAWAQSHLCTSDESNLVQLAYMPEEGSDSKIRLLDDTPVNLVPAANLAMLSGGNASNVSTDAIPNFQNAQDRAGSVVDAILPPVGESTLNDVTTLDVTTMVAATCVIVWLDFYVFPKITKSNVGRMSALVLMLGLSLAYNIAVFKERGSRDALQWSAGYILEWVLSFDNLFAFYLVFKTLKVPDAQVYQALAIGVYGAAILRVVFFVFMREALDASPWLDEAVGVLLVISGGGAMLESDNEDDDDSEPTGTRFFMWLFGSRLMESFDDSGRLLVHDGEKWRVTMLALTACIIMIVDILFALDSVGAKSHEFANVYLNVSSSIMAMFTSRQAYAIISALAESFAYFKFGISAVLVLIGADLVLSPWGGMDERYFSSLIAASFGISILVSVLKPSSEAMKKQAPDFED